MTRTWRLDIAPPWVSKFESDAQLYTSGTPNRMAANNADNPGKEDAQENRGRHGRSLARFDGAGGVLNDRLPVWRDMTLTGLLTFCAVYALAVAAPGPGIAA